MYDTLVQPTTKPAAGQPVERGGTSRPLAAGAPHDGVVATGLGKRYGELWAVRHLDLDVAPGTVLGLLGHNGAGKTTAIRMLTTLSTPTEGAATVGGHDVVRYPARCAAASGWRPSRPPSTVCSTPTSTSR